MCFLLRPGSPVIGEPKVLKLLGEKPQRINSRTLWLKAAGLGLVVWFCGIPVRAYVGA